MSTPFSLSHLLSQIDQKFIFNWFFFTSTLQLCHMLVIHQAYLDIHPVKNLMQKSGRKNLEGTQQNFIV